MLYLRGTRDLLVGKRAVRRVSSAAQDLRVHEVEASHFILQNRASESAKVVGEFCDSLNVQG